MANGDKKLCLFNDDTSVEVAFYDCITSIYLEFEYATDYTIRKLQSNHCLRVNDEKAFLESCNSDSMRWGFNDMTRQIMEIQSIKCLEKHDAGHKWQLRLGPCNADQESKHQKWKFEFYNPHYTNSTKLTRLTPITILDWHRNYSIYDIPFPPYPDIIRRKWNSQYDTLEEEISAFLIDQNSTEFDSLTPLETTTQNVAATTTLIESSKIYTQEEPDLNQESNKTETDTNIQEKDKNTNNDNKILITQLEDGEEASITKAIENLIIDEESTTTTTPKLTVSSTSTTFSTTQKTATTTPMSSSTSSSTQATTTITPKTESTTLSTETTIPTNITVTSTTSATTSSTSTTTIETITSSYTTPQTTTAERIETKTTTTTDSTIPTTTTRTARNIPTKKQSQQKDSIIGYQNTSAEGSNGTTDSNRSKNELSDIVRPIIQTFHEQYKQNLELQREMH